MNVDIKFYGAAQSVTGSKYLIRADETQFLVDCGLFQGPAEMRRRNWEDLFEDPSKIDFVLLTHAHIDHSGYLPRLVKTGFKGKIICTEATTALLKIMLMDAAKLQEEEAKWAYKKGYSRHKKPMPLFETKDTEKCLQLVEPIKYDQSFDVTEAITVCYRNAGHILGSAMIETYLKGDSMTKKILFSGDLGKYNQPMHEAPFKQTECDVLLVESTYANRLNENNNTLKDLGKIINDAIHDGCIVIPAFTVGRTQQILFYLSKLLATNAIPDVRVYVDSPMAISVTDQYRLFRDQHKLHLENSNGSVFDHSFIHYIRPQEESVNLNLVKNKAIIISASGMATGGRILHHLYHRLSRKNDTILFVGYQAIGTKGRAILEGAEHINIFGISVPVKARIMDLPGLSAHADKNDLHQWLGNFEDKPKRTFIIHGETNAAIELQNHLHKEGWSNVIVPNFLENFRLFQSI